MKLFLQAFQKLFLDVTGTCLDIFSGIGQDIVTNNGDVDHGKVCFINVGLQDSKAALSILILSSALLLNPIPVHIKGGGGEGRSTSRSSSSSSSSSRSYFSGNYSSSGSSRIHNESYYRYNEDKYPDHRRHDEYPNWNPKFCFNMPKENEEIDAFKGCSITAVPVDKKFAPIEKRSFRTHYIYDVIGSVGSVIVRQEWRKRWRDRNEKRYDG